MGYQMGRFDLVPRLPEPDADPDEEVLRLEPREQRPINADLPVSTDESPGEPINGGVPPVDKDGPVGYD